MEHRLVQAIEEAFGWSGAEAVGTGFARGHLDDELASRLLTPNRLLDIVMRRSLQRPQCRIVGKGEEVHPGVYYTQNVSSVGQGISVVDMRAVQTLLSEGATLILDQVNAFDPILEVACRALQWWSHERVEVNAYLTTNDAEGFPLHWDEHDVLVVQLAGEKEWEVRGPSYPKPMYRDAEPDAVPSEDVIWTGRLKAGDVMHIPRGHWHRASRTGSGSGTSLHATFGITRRTGVNWLTWLANWSHSYEAFRHDLDRTGADFGALEDAAARLMKEQPPAKFLEAHAQEALPPRHVPFLEIFGALESVVCISQFRPQIQDNGDTVEVVAAGKRLLFAVKALPSLRLLLSGRPVHLEQVQGLVGAEVGEVASILVEEGLCAMLTPELAAGCAGLVPDASS